MKKVTKPAWGNYAGNEMSLWETKWSERAEIEVILLKMGDYPLKLVVYGKQIWYNLKKQSEISRLEDQRTK